MLDKKSQYSIIIPAGGSGNRLKGFLQGKSKQFATLKDKTILEIVIEKMAEKVDFREFILAFPEENFAENSKYFLSKFSFLKIVKGGKTRQESVYNSLKNIEINDGYGKILIHDAVRPFFKKDDIDRLFDVAEKNGNAILAVKAKDTIRQANPVLNSEKQVNIVSNGILDREKIWMVQTPQIFEFSILKKAYDFAIEKNFEATDDAMIMEYFGEKIFIAEGSYENFKITTDFDFKIAEMMIDKNL